MKPAAQVGAYLDRLFANRPGLVVIGLGHEGRFNKPNGRAYRAGAWREHSYRWPGERKQIIREAIRSASEDDVYVMVTLRRGNHPARKGSCVGSAHCWADLDAITAKTQERLQRLLSDGSFLVHSGREGHLHPYFALDGFYDADVIENLNKAIMDYLGADNKWSETALLRLPGTLNHKGRAAGGDSFPVVFEDVVGSEIPPWSPDALKALLGPSQSLWKKRAPAPKRRTPVAEIVPVAPEPIPSDIPGDILKRLGSWSPTQEGGRTDRSALLHCFVKDVMSLGFSDGVIMALALLHEPAQDKWGDDEILSREIQRSIIKIRPGHQHVGHTCTQVGCVQGANPKVAAQARKIRAHFQEHYRSPRTFKTDYKVIDAFLQRALEIGALELDMAQRELSLLSTVSNRGTVAKSIMRLRHADYLKWLRDPDGRPLRVGKGPLPTRAYRYRLTLPVDKPEPHMHRNVGFVLCGPGSALLDPKEDMWWYSGGLSSARRTYELLLGGVTNEMELADIEGLSKRSITRHLQRLATHDLAQQDPDGSWTALERAPDDIASEVGMRGKGKQQALRHRIERKKYQHYLAARGNGDEDFQDLIDQGYEWIGPTGQLLVPPDAAKRWRERASMQ